MAATSANSIRPTPKAVPSQSASSGTNVLNQKFGPFPAWVYLAAVGVGIYAYTKRKGSTSSKSTTAAQSGGTTGDGTGAVTQSAVEQTLQANAPGATTNPQWEANAESVLVGYGYPEVQVQSALNTYLAGGVLSSIQQEIVNATIAAVGAPPSPPSSNPTSTSSPTTPPAGSSNPTPPQQKSPAPASTGGETSSGDGEGLITIGGKQYIILGKAGGTQYAVGGGAPVFFGSGNSIAQGTAAEQAAEKNGGYAYVPVEFKNLVHLQGES